VVGNRCHLKDSRKVSVEEAEKVSGIDLWWYLCVMLSAFTVCRTAQSSVYWNKHWYWWKCWRSMYIHTYIIYIYTLYGMKILCIDVVLYNAVGTIMAFDQNIQCNLIWYFLLFYIFQCINTFIFRLYATLMFNTWLTFLHVTASRLLLFAAHNWCCGGGLASALGLDCHIGLSLFLC